jgi:protein O-GlcNAc transferase
VRGVVTAGDPLAQVLALHQAGRTAEAVTACRSLAQGRPGDARAHHLIGLLLLALGRPAEAVVDLATSSRLAPDQAAPRQQAALAWHRMGRLREAARDYRRTLAVAPDMAEAHGNLGLIESASPRLARGTHLRPDDPVLLGNLGAVAGSLRVLRRAAVLAPDSSALHISAGNEHRLRGALSASRTEYRRALATGRRADALGNMALSDLDDGRLFDAIGNCRRSLADLPASGPVLSNLSAVLKRLGRIGEAIGMARRSLRCASSPEGWNNLGEALQAIGEVGAAAASYRRSGALDKNSGWHGNLLFCLCYDAATTNEALYAEAVSQAERHAPKARAKPLRRVGPGRLKVGVLSSDLRDHPVGRNVLGLFEHRRDVELHAYAEVTTGDATTARFWSLADGWARIVGMSDEAVAERMRRDGMDVLLVLAGHTARNRPMVAAWGAAPVQVSFHDLMTSGLSSMDWWVTDGVLHPEGTRERFTERLWRLPCFYLHRPPEEAPDIVESPGGPLAFVSCNNPAKLTPEVIALWARVLAAVPGSRLILKYKDWLADRAMRETYAARFAEVGIGPERLDFRGGDVGQGEHLGLLREADIALDPFPFNGSTTSFEALWMGVPVVTLAGERFLGRVGASVLTALGLEELVATDGDGYVARAVALAEDRRRLSGLRRSLRGRVAASPLCDAATYTRNFEAMLGGMAGR